MQKRLKKKDIEKGYRSSSFSFFPFPKGEINFNYD